MDPGSAAATLTRFLTHLLATSGLELEYTLEAGAPVDTLPASPGQSITAPIDVAFSGLDVPLLTAHSAELLHAIETVAAAILRLEPSEHHLLRFDAGGLRAARARWLEASAADAVARVRRTGHPVAFPPMNSRERRLIHLAVAPSGLHSSSTGDGPRRTVVVYPPGQTAAMPAAISTSRGRPPARRPSPPPQHRFRRRRSAFRRPDPDLRNRKPAIVPPDEDANAASEADRIRAIRERFRSR